MSRYSVHGLLLLGLVCPVPTVAAQQLDLARVGMTAPDAASSGTRGVTLRAGKNRTKGALIGAGVGALIGGVLGPLTSSCEDCDGSLVEAASTGQEVLIGAFVGAAIGAVVGGVFLAPDRAEHRGMASRRGWLVGLRLGG